jgi:hypothetical protein
MPPCVVPYHVVRDAEEPGPNRVLVVEDDTPALLPRCEEDGRGQVLGERPIGCPPKAEVVDLVRVTLVDLAKSLGLARRGAPPEHPIGQRRHRTFMSDAAGRFPA